jgi:hypothetical protein
MQRIILHWTAGGGRASDVDRRAYHRLVEYDGTIVAGTHEIADNVVTADGDYAAHTRHLNTGSIGVALCGMHGAREAPFDPGPSPITERQWRAACILIADLAHQHSIPITPQTVLTHAEVEPVLGVPQRGKWDITRLPFRRDLAGAIPVGEYLREMVRQVAGIAPARDPRPTLRHGNAAPLRAVRELQADLAARGYHAGRADGLFGARTRAAVLAFQADHGLVTDGIVGPATWAALDEAPARAPREVAEADLEAEVPVAETRKMERGLSAVEGTTVSAASIGGLLEVGAAAQRAEGALEAAQRILVTYWPILLVALVVVVAARFGKRGLRRVRASLVEDARAGRFLGG